MFSSAASVALPEDQAKGTVVMTTGRNQVGVTYAAAAAAAALLPLPSLPHKDKAVRGALQTPAVGGLALGGVENTAMIGVFLFTVTF